MTYHFNATYFGEDITNTITGIVDAVDFEDAYNQAEDLHPEANIIQVLDPSFTDLGCCEDCGTPFKQDGAFLKCHHCHN